MDLTNEINFGDLQKHERYKKLQRNLKLARIKQTEIIEKSEFNLREKFKTKFNLKTSGVIPPPSWPSFSSINADPSDFNSTVTSQTSRTGSVVLASSRHLRNFISKKTIQHKSMASSSVKQYSGIDQSVDDRAIMPPPSSSNIILPPVKKLSPSNAMKPPNQSRHPSSFNDDLSSHGKPSFSDANSSIDQPEDSGCPQNQSREKPVIRDFYRWRVVLNDQGQLLIKGILDNGRIARSKPVLKMISSTKLESIYKHTYCLHGNIIDEKNDLPKYIYTKFYSGFPDDWENVHQIWKNYVAQGSRESYRWPIDVSLSDDDLNSEITDITQIQESSEKKYQESGSIDKSTPQRSSGYSSEIQQEKNSKPSENLSKDVTLRGHSHFPTRNKTVEVLSFSNEKENRSQDENRSVDENRSGNLYTALNYAQSLRDFIFEDKLKIIHQNLLNENCPPEYARYVKETIENLNYLKSCKITNMDESEAKRPKLESKNDSRIVEDFQRNCSTPLFKPEERMLNASTQVPDNEVERISNFQRVKQRDEKYEANLNISPQILNPQISSVKTNGDFSESETYAGIPKISVDRIFQSKPFHSRYRERKLERNSKNNKAHMKVEDCRNNLGYDSSVSLTEEEIQKNFEDRASKAGSNSNIAQLRMNASKGFVGRTDSNLDPNRQNRAPLEVMRKTYFEENRKRIENSNSPNSKNPNFISSDNEKRKTLSDKENMESNKQSVYSEASQMKETQCLQHLEVNNDPRGKQKWTKRPPKSQFLDFESDDNKHEQIEKDEGIKNATFFKRTETFQDLEKTTSGNQEILVNDSFGSEKNPKLLESWTPLLTFDGKDYHLVFEGILLNAVGRPMKKKFTSNHVVRRVSSKIIETVDHQFYKLVGDLYNTKHVVPKELLPQCRYGCPAKIEHFCATWLKLTGENNIIMERLQKQTTELPQGIQTSSRGRRIIPPLNYWADERVVIKDDNAVYKPADTKDYFVSSRISSPKMSRNPGDDENQTDLTKETGGKSTSKKVDKKPNPNLSNEDPLSSTEARKGSSNSEEVEQPGKNKVAHKLIFSSSDSEEAQEKISTRLKRKSRKNIDLNESLSRTGKNACRQNENSKNFNHYGLRKRQKIDHKFDSDIKSDTDSSPVDKREKTKLPMKSKPSQVRCQYKKNIQVNDAILSDDQLSMA